jgi:uncharacterized membrane protein YcaP (DUF421 family)
MFFESWNGIARVLIMGGFAYVALIVLLRASGKRTLSKMNAFDLVVTVALGSTLASVLLSKDLALAEGVVAFALLIGLQFAITWISVRSPAVLRFIKAEPSLLVHQGRLLRRAMKAERVAEQEIRAALRAQGISSLDQVHAVVLETDGSFTVLPKADPGAAWSLANVDRHPTRGT